MSYTLSQEEELLCAKRVARGAEFLDMRMHDWFLRINTGLLDMTDGLRCVIGQLYHPNGFTQTIVHDFRWDEKTAEEHGVIVYDGDETDEFIGGPQWAALYAELQECWLGEIANRMNGVHSG
ncbi:hypothetical protein AB0K16_21905 [Nonomuraea jabiensis]|uniref:hypothetical protein n=1 Tax=Nonomuraea jabiensis TaxID=882448 RepID=UPI003442BAFE